MVESIKDKIKHEMFSVASRVVNDFDISGKICVLLFQLV